LVENGLRIVGAAAPSRLLFHSISRKDRFSMKSNFLPKPSFPRTLWIHFSAKIWRYWTAYFRPETVASGHRRREGECRLCGACCALLFRCVFFDSEGRCAIYGSRPKICRVFPISERDIRDVAAKGVRCGFRFKEEKNRADREMEIRIRRSGADPRRPCDLPCE